MSVHAVSPKRTHDSREVFDGVPSMHDPKSALLIAKLSSMDLSREWKTVHGAGASGDCSLVAAERVERESVHRGPGVSAIDPLPVGAR